MLAAPRPAFSQTAGPPVQVQAPVPAPPAAPVTPSSPVSDAPAVLPPQPPSAPPPPARPAHHPGFLEELGKVLKDSASHLSSTWKGSQKTLEDLNAKTKDATESLTRVQSVVTGRTACPVTANGAPDCVAAAEQLCKGKGFKSGKSLDIETAEKCSAKVYLSGRTGAPGECRTENFVTRAICQ
jgi:hypothetical protein